jgi:hypothetical protein
MFSANLRRSEVLPVLLSPIRTILNSASKANLLYELEMFFFDALLERLLA